MWWNRADYSIPESRLFNIKHSARYYYYRYGYVVLNIIIKKLLKQWRVLSNSNSLKTKTNILYFFSARKQCEFFSRLIFHFIKGSSDKVSNASMQQLYVSLFPNSFTIIIRFLILIDVFQTDIYIDSRFGTYIYMDCCDRRAFKNQFLYRSNVRIV